MGRALASPHVCFELDSPHGERESFDSDSRLGSRASGAAHAPAHAPASASAGFGSAFVCRQDERGQISQRTFFFFPPFFHLRKRAEVLGRAVISIVGWDNTSVIWC